MSGRRRVGRFLLFGGLLWTFGIASMTWGIASYQGLTYRCIVEGPSSPLAAISERSDLVVGHLALLPLGRSCDWARAVGDGHITAYSSWTPTLVAGAGLTVALAGAALLLTKRRTAQPA